MSQREKNFRLNQKNLGSFISITVNDYGIGIHKKVMEIKSELSEESAIIHAFTTSFSSKTLDNDYDSWEFDSGSKEIRLEHKGYGLLYCLLFVFRNLGRIKICSGNLELKLFTRIDKWAEEQECNTPVVFSDMINSSENKYNDYFEIVIKKNDHQDNFVGTQILIEIPISYTYFK